MILVVPAYDWLIDKEHHKAVGAVRRYSRNRLLPILSRHPMELVRMTHLFGSVLPAVAGYRCAGNLLSRNKTDQPRSDLKPLNPILNRLLFKSGQYGTHVVAETGYSVREFHTGSGAENR